MSENKMNCDSVGIMWESLGDQRYVTIMLPCELWIKP